MIRMQQIIKTALDKDFIKTDNMAEMLGLAFKHDSNCMIFGPPGYGKSEMVMSAIREFELDQPQVIDTGKVDENEEPILKSLDIPQTYVKTLTVDTDVAELLGGLNIKRFQQNSQVWYNCNDSFMNYPVVIFEEFADCPPSTLAMLKDILTAKMFRNGSQQYALKTNVVIAITNHRPEDVADLGDWAKAILDRFPIRGEITWDSHAKPDYLELFAKLSPKTADEAFAPEVMNQIAELSEQSAVKGAPISPRVARNAIEACDSWYKEVDDTVARQNLEHLSPLRYVPEYASVMADMQKTIEEQRLREKARAEIEQAEKAMREARKRFNRIAKDGSLTVNDKSREMEGIKQLAQALMTGMSLIALSLIHI